ncbi:hypothetical protein DKK68_06290 [Bifidobacterium asteroides]|uniref:hypothetical protein n=1 Tax=Bifidobacterium asteroides TaxID=1684 RepID=UPI000D78252D|nr:hypothetical protein [Bifidobacterium asteroides]PXY87365.1 hypothetical protein DKK68_06290 [Bifidobacterium asteroides]
MSHIRTIVQEDGATQGSGTGPDTEAEPNQHGLPEGEPHGEPETEETELKRNSRKWEGRAKANMEALEELKKLNGTQKSELEKAAKHTKDLEAKLAKYEAERQQHEWRVQVAKKTGVPADLLRGSTLDEVQAHAESIKQYLQNKQTSDQKESGTAAGYAPKVGTTPARRGSIPLSEQIKEAEKNHDLNRAMLLKVMQLDNSQTGGPDRRTQCQES